ncbi:MAG: hypothetical protein EXR52_08010 [Dehalococcoidia bacterium]|nr:hypothetical protein [Dehalococcoidia bacterium]
MTAHTTHAGHAEGHDHHGSRHVNPRPVLPATPQALTTDLVDRITHPKLGGLFVVSGLLFLVGIVGVFMKVSGGYADRSTWGFYAAVFAWVLSTGCSAPILSVATRLTKGYWRKPLVRIAELFGATTILLVLLYLPLIPVIPPPTSHMSFWVNGSWVGEPQVVLLFSVLGLALCGIGYIFTSVRADAAAVGDQTGGRKGLAAMLASQWGGTPHQWKVMRQGLSYLASFYLMFVIFVHFLVSVELAITLVPGWRDPIFPAFHAVSGVQAGLASLILMLYAMRRWGGYKDYLVLDQFWNPAKLLMSFTMLWFYMWWSAFIIFWYGRTPAEQGVLLVTGFGPYLYVFVTGFILNFALPLLMLIWNPIRVSIPGPVVAAVIIVIGNFFDRWRIYGGSFGTHLVDGQIQHAVPVDQLPIFRMPDVPDLMVLAGALGGMIFLFMLAARMVPVMSLWELTEGQLLTRTKMLGKNQVVIIGKPE